jgi:hypothetical protein
MFKRLRMAVVATIIGVLAGSVAVQAPAAAVGGSGTIEGWLDSSSGWVIYTTVRSTSGTVRFQPSNLIFQAGTYSTLNLKLYKVSYPGGYLQYDLLGSPQLWVNDYSTKTLVSGAPYGTLFVIVACCRSSTDTYWKGTLSY